MTFAREKRLLIGVLALVAPLPLPFNEVVQWPTLILYEVAVALFLVRAARGADGWLPNWAMNLLGLAYLPVLVADLSLFWRGRALPPLVHLVLFTLSVKLFALKRERDKWHAVVAVFFLFLAAMGSSVHPTVMLYLAVFLALAVHLLVRWVGFHEAGVHPSARGAARVPVLRFVAGSSAVALLLAVPLFALLPRLRQPYVVVPVAGLGSDQVTGFSDRMSLDAIRRVRTSSAVAFRLSFEGQMPVPFSFRFRAASYDRFDGTSWRAGPRAQRAVSRGGDGFLSIAEGRPRNWATIWLKRLGSPHLPLPVETVTLDRLAGPLLLDSSGVVTLPVEPVGTLELRAGLAREPARGWLVGDPEAPTGAELDAGQVTPRIAELAARVAGEGSAAQRAARLEGYLASRYGYTLDLTGLDRERPVEHFLFEERQGHCELFASSLVVMLRSQGIPARLVTGFYGAELNPLERYFVVRQSNAHAWVEALLPEQGWTTLDPTPAAGRPGTTETSWLGLAAQAYDYLLFRWDRYVLTYGFGDQVDVFLRLREALHDLWQRFGRQADATPGGIGEEALPVASPLPPAEPALAERRWQGLFWLPLALSASGVALWLIRRRRTFDAKRVYRRLRAELAVGGEELPASVAPLEVARRVGERRREAAAGAARIVASYLRETYGGERLSGADLEALELSLREIRTELRRSA